MSTIDEIMGAIGRHGDDCIRDADAASESFDTLREMIAAALADALREGAEQMRNAVAEWHQEVGLFLDESDVVVAIRALPLPTGGRQAVLLTDEQPMAPASAAHGEIALRWRVQADGLYAVDMMVSNLSTEAQAHAAMAYVQSLFAGDEMAGKH